MKFLLDVGISPRLGELLTHHGHQYRYMPSFYSPKTDDIDILKIAIENQETIITHDLDFGSLLAFSGDNRPSTILFRIHNIVPQLFYKLIIDNWTTIEQPLIEGALVVIETHSVRIRKLPLTQFGIRK
jgi:predicted nuclease of predicted toxin-antitoxin system